MLWRKSGRDRHHAGKSPFTNNDEPTPRVVPSAQEEKARLRAEAAAGAGTPGYLTKQQQQQQPLDPRTAASDRLLSPPERIGALVSNSGSAKCSTSSQVAGGGGRPSTSDELLQLTTSPKPDSSPRAPSSPKPADSRRTVGHASGLTSSQAASGDGEGIWRSFLNMFGSAPKRLSASATNLGLDTPELTGRGPDLARVPLPRFAPSSPPPPPTLIASQLGDSRDLPPGPSSLLLNLPIASSGASESILKGKVLTEGRRNSRSSSISPRGASSSLADTEDEERMRTYLQLESAEEADFVGSHRKAAALAMQISDSNSSAAKGAGGKTVQVAAGEAAPQRRSRAEADAADFRTRAKEADEGRVRGGASSGQERRSMGGTPLAEGEAVVQRKADFEAPRQGAHERVFGGRKKSMISGAQLRGADLDDETREVGVAEASATSAAARAAAARAHREKLEQFDREQADWFSLKRACSVPSNYGGVRLRSPPTADDIDRMISSFTKPDPEPLHQHFLYELLLGVYRMWECPPPGYLGQSAKSVMDLPEPPDGSKLIIVGDTHGQLADVLWIFAEYGLPSRKNIYLFNGDVADRGSHAIEIFALLFSFMLHEPGSVFLSRGNHENMEINERAQHYGGGFAEEVRGKYDPEAFMLFTKLFELLPLAFVVAQKALVIHGGLWRHRGVTLSQMRKLAHRRQCPEAPQTYDDYIFFDLLWSDPHPEDGDGVHESSRGDGCILFGRDMTVEFLRRNSLQLIIRSHQLPSDGHGYEVLHDGRCITVFSASNYGGSCYNAGAILVWEGGEIDAHEFIAPNLEAQQKARSGEGYAALLRRFSSRGAEWEEEVGCAAEPPHVARLDGEIVRMIKERVCRYRHELAAEFAKLDKTRQGSVKLEDWGGCMKTVLSLDLPWLKYQPWLAELTETGDINYGAFLSRFEVRLREQYAGWQRTVLQMFYNSLLAADLQITELLGFFDRDGDGMVSLSECTKALSSLELGLSTQQVQQLVLVLGFDGDDGKGDGSVAQQRDAGGEPCVDLEKYLKRLALVADHSVIARSEQELLDLQQIAKWIEGVAARSGKSLSALFMSWDDNSDGYIDCNDAPPWINPDACPQPHGLPDEEFVTCCFNCQEQLYLADPSSLEYIYTREEFDELARTVDQAKTGRINYLSFLGLFSSAEHGAVQGQTSLSDSPLLQRTTTSSVFIERICATIWSNDVLLSRALRGYDSKSLGTVTPTQFAKALEAMNDALAKPFTPLTPQQISGIVGSLPLDTEGRINYKEFMAAFEIVDKHQEA